MGFLFQKISEIRCLFPSLRVYGFSTGSDWSSGNERDPILYVPDGDLFVQTLFVPFRPRRTVKDGREGRSVTGD